MVNDKEEFIYAISNYWDCELIYAEKALNDFIENEIFKFADYISSYFDSPQLYLNPTELIRLYKDFNEKLGE